MPVLLPPPRAVKTFSIAFGAGSLPWYREMNAPLDIAVIAVGGVFPGAANTAVFWRNIAAGRNAIAEVAPGRWIAPPRAMVAPGPVPDKALSAHCGLVRDFTFDPGGFRLPAEALVALDPLYHLVLQAGREAVGNGCLENTAPERIGTILAAIALPLLGVIIWFWEDISEWAKEAYESVKSGEGTDPDDLYTYEVPPL